MSHRYWDSLDTTAISFTMKLSCEDVHIHVYKEMILNVNIICSCKGFICYNSSRRIVHSPFPSSPVAKPSHYSTTSSSTPMTAWPYQYIEPIHKSKETEVLLSPLSKQRLSNHPMHWVVAMLTEWMWWLLIYFLQWWTGGLRLSRILRFVRMMCMLHHPRPHHSHWFDCLIHRDEAF